MSIRLMNAVWGKQVSGATQTVLLVLCDFASDEGICWPSQAVVAWKAGCSDRTVRTVIAELEEAGAITTLQSGQGRGRSSVLKINLSALAEKPEITSAISEENRKYASTFVTTKPEICDIKPEVATSYKPLEPSVKEKKKTIVKEKPRETELAAEWQPGKDEIAYALTKGLTNWEKEAENFRDYYRGHGKKMMRWDLTWKKWVRTSIEWRDERAQKTNTNGRAKTPTHYEGDVY